MPPATQSSIQEIIEDLEPSHPSKIPSDNKEAPNLAEAIHLMTEELKRHDNKNNKAKAKEPDTLMVPTAISSPVFFSFAISISITICHMPMTMQRLPLH